MAKQAMPTMRQSPVHDISVITSRHVRLNVVYARLGTCPRRVYRVTAAYLRQIRTETATVAAMLDITHRMEPFSSTSVWRLRLKPSRKK